MNAKSFQPVVAIRAKPSPFRVIQLHEYDLSMEEAVSAVGSYQEFWPLTGTKIERLLSDAQFHKYNRKPSHASSC